ncbi:inactive poly [ADP-ribose] polymerase rcd1 [Phtheirospermum japonicum]|uniref:Inactive poly [ADP-ribose] polymerase rcd1 n=1 Tax=Phtheirospermum japonicum TaxID=374723 RepID=A0A830CMX9_9LAMI|nr:inactive poly [ADP-ribose] polymerase rcd1 [Phtheirospermum japonicum]
MNSLNFSEAMMMTKKRAEGKSKAKNFAPRSSTAVSCEPLIQNYSNFKRSSCPGRIMFYEDGSWIDYPNEVVELIKLGFMDGKPAVEAQVMGLNCFFDFYRMLEIDLESGNQRSISWIDVDGKCFFPKMFVNTYEIDSEDDFVNCGENFPKIQIDIKISENSVSSEDLKLDQAVKLSKRKREEDVINEKMEGSLSSTNVKRQMVGSESQSARWPKTRILGAEQKGYAIVKNLLLSGLGTVEPGVTVTSVHQCARMGPLDRARLEIFSKKLEITKKTRGESNMVFAWYGTSAKGVESILTHGFGIPSNLSHSEGHGIGIHLSPIRSPQNSAVLSEADENGEKHVVLCRVILGKCEKVEAGSKQSYPSSVDYDTGVDDINNPRWYTVWHANMNTHILPECVVSYRPGSIKANTSRTTPASVFVTKLFSKLAGSLPQPRLQELQTLWGSCKEGKLGRDTFMKQLRSVVGDEVLRSTIQEIRG